MKNIKIITFLFCIIFFASRALALLTERWTETTATFTVVKNDIRDLKLENTVLGDLVKSTGKPLGELLSPDGKTLVSFKIVYTAPVRAPNESSAKSKAITQVGLYNSLSPELKARLSDQTSSMLSVKIGYRELDPITIQFIFDGQLYQAPALISDTMDANWKKID